MFSIAIDGPSGAGKSSVAKRIAEYFGILYLDTGALYRAIGYYFIDNKVDYNNEEVVSGSIADILIDVKYENGRQRVFVNGVDVTEKIRTNDVSMVASKISSMSKIRDFLMDTQRGIAEKNSVVMDGRDIGTVVLPDADVKIFLTASLEARTTRRYDELKKVDSSVNYETVRELIEKRDFNDSNRKVAPLRPADDAIIFDSTNYTFEEVIKELIRIIEERLK